MVILAHLCNLQSFGVPYMSPIAPLRLADWGDFIYRRPLSWMLRRPGQTAQKNIVRQKGVKKGNEPRP